MRYLLMLLFCLPLMASAVEFDEFTQSLPLGQTLQVFEDAGGQATIDDIRAQAANGHFKPHHKATLNAGYSRSVFWLKIDLHYRPTNPAAQRTWLLELAYPPLDRLDLYAPDTGGAYRLVRQTGDALPFDSREIRQNNYLFDLSFTAAGQLDTAALASADFTVNADGTLALTNWVPAAPDTAVPPVWTPNGAAASPTGINLDLRPSTQFSSAFAVSSVGV